jgi:hypothetical protein
MPFPRRETEGMFFEWLRSFRAAVQPELRRRMPRWLDRARARMAWVSSTLLTVLSDAEEDSTVWQPRTLADTSLLLNTEPFAPFGYGLDLPEGPGAVVLMGEPIGEFDAESRSVLRLVGPRRAFFDLSSGEYHGPTALLNLYVETSPSETKPLDALAFIPVATYIHEIDLARGAQWLMASLGRTLLDVLEEIARSALGDRYVRLRRRRLLDKQIRINKERGVLVLGSYAAPYITELREVEDRLERLGYDPHLVGDMPDIPVQSNEEKVRMWALVSRFAVMVDRVPGGHIAEYLILRNQRSVLGICRPEEEPPSTFMIGDEPLADINFFRLFPIPEANSATILMPDVARWAEEFLAQREAQYSQAYPWRR